jgi:hypothetical protein
MIKKGVSQLVAKVLAERAYEELKSKNEKLLVLIPKEVKKQNEYRELCALIEKRSSLNRKIFTLESRLRRKFQSAQISTSGHVPTVRHRANHVGERELYRQILTASHVDGIAQEKLVAHVLKRYKYK